MSDERDAVCRRGLKAMVGRLLGNAEAARELLRHKAQVAPTSAEAQAWRLLDEGVNQAHAWMRDAGGPAPAESNGRAAAASPKQVTP